jgi:predicted ATPase
MITKIRIRNFKKLENVEFDLTENVVLVGPNNSGKTTILQALTLFDIGIKKIAEQYRRNSNKRKRTGIPINKQDLLAIPVSSSKLIWHNQFVRAIDRTAKNGKSQETKNVLIEIEVEGVNENGIVWSAALELDYANSESFYVRPLRITPDGKTRKEIDKTAFDLKIAFLQPMSGISTTEDKLTQGSIDVRIGEGKTADVIRNICYHLLYPENNDIDAESSWQKLVSIMQRKFGAALEKPVFVPETGAIEMSYRENDHRYDLASSGRGFQQTLLLLAYLFTYPGRTILLDEPDAHLEVVRQRETYNLINDIARELKSQLIIASHSEIVLNEAAERDTIIAIYDNNCFPILEPQLRKQFSKLLTEIGWEKYLLAKEYGHILFFEGATDYKILVEFAKIINHKALGYLEKANVQYTSDNVPSGARKIFHGLRQSLQGALKGYALFDRIDYNPDDLLLQIKSLKRREIENYLKLPDVLLRWAGSLGQNNLFINYVENMESCIKENIIPAMLKNPDDNRWIDMKVSDEMIPPIMSCFKSKSDINFHLHKGRYYELVKFMKPDEVNQEIIEILDDIYNLIFKASHK